MSKPLSHTKFLSEFRKLSEKGYKEVCRRAINELKRNKNLTEFYMAMGTYYFCGKDGQILHDYTCSQLNHFMIEWDGTFKFSGIPTWYKKVGNRIIKQKF